MGNLGHILGALVAAVPPFESEKYFNQKNNEIIIRRRE